MKARLKKPIGQVEELIKVGGVCEIELSGVGVYGAGSDPWLSGEWLCDTDDLFEYFEVLQGVSDTTQQQIREQLTRIFSAPLVVDDGQFAEIFHEQIEEFMSAMNGLLSGSIESSKE